MSRTAFTKIIREQLKNCKKKLLAFQMFHDEMLRVYSPEFVKPLTICFVK